MSASPPRLATASTAISRSLAAAWSRSARAVQHIAVSGAATRRPARLAGLDAMHVGHVEINRLGRLLAVAALVIACLLINAWSRIDLRQTSVQLHEAQAAFDAARAEHARLRMELAALQAPAQLDAAARQLALEPATDIVIVPAP